MEQEKTYLNFVLKLIGEKLKTIKEEIKASGEQVDYLLSFVADNFRDMDKEEVATQNQILSNEDDKLASLQEQEQKLLVQKQRPYFARIDFRCENNDGKIYIGVNSLVKKGLQLPVVCDWRAPVSSMYYDFELGKAFYYDNDNQKIEGEVLLKRQYKIKEGKLEYFFDSSIMVMDEILQEELAKNTSGQMRSIISSIQKDQNALIRNVVNKTLILQGFAGSGKTAIALHRVAYLLYKFKNSLSSNEIMVISPNSFFAYYISGVLPELGENNILEIQFVSLAKKELKNLKLLKREQMIEAVLEDKTRLSEVKYKESNEFFENLKIFLTGFANNCFEVKDIKSGKFIFEKEKIKKLYFETYKEKSPGIKINWIADYIMDELAFSNYNTELYLRIKKVLYNMFITTDIVQIYKEFLRAINMSDIETKAINYEDIAPILYIQDFLFEIKKETNIKHLVIDEMQDYSPLHFDLFEKIFPCDKTLLGDIHQSLFKEEDSDFLDMLKAQIPNSALFTLDKCYRSTKQINDFTMKIAGIQAKSIERNGEEVEQLEANQDEYKAVILNEVYKMQPKYEKIAIICKTFKKASEIYMLLSEIDNLTLIDENTASETGQVCVISSAFAKGLEFDGVILLFDKPNSSLDKNLFYVAATRALHKLVVISKKKTDL